VLSLLARAQGGVAHPPERDGLRVSCLQFSVILAKGVAGPHDIFVSTGRSIENPTVGGKRCYSGFGSYIPAPALECLAGSLIVGSALES
jgi:hypothetical protein